MGKYPTLSTLSGVARIIGILGLVFAGILLLVGLVQVASSTSGQYGGNPFKSYAGMIKMFAAFSIACGCLILIIVGEVAVVFIDIETNTADTTRLLRSRGSEVERAVSTRREETSWTGVALTPAPVPGTAPIQDVSEEEIKDTIALAKEAGFTVEVDGTKLTFLRGGAATYCHNPFQIRRFRRMNRLGAAPPAPDKA